MSYTIHVIYIQTKQHPILQHRGENQLSVRNLEWEWPRADPAYVCQRQLWHYALQEQMATSSWFLSASTTTRGDITPHLPIRAWQFTPNTTTPIPRDMRCYGSSWPNSTRLRSWAAFRSRFITTRRTTIPFGSESPSTKRNSFSLSCLPWSSSSGVLHLRTDNTSCFTCWMYQVRGVCPNRQL
jgi:hypothetical protein